MDDNNEIGIVEEEWADFWESIYDVLPEEADEDGLITFFDQEAIEILASHIIMRSNGINKVKGYLH